MNNINLIYIQIALFIWFLVFHFTVESIDDKPKNQSNHKVTKNKKGKGDKKK